jgi:hypothetical protein
MSEHNDEIADRSRGENLTGSGCGDDSSRDMYADAADIAVAEFDLAGVQARSDLQADPLPSYSPPLLVLGAAHQLSRRGHAATLSAVLAQSNAHSVPPRHGRVVAIGFPVAGDGPVVGLGRPLGNVDHVRDPVLALADLPRGPTNRPTGT